MGSLRGVCTQGQRVQRSCTALIASFFDGFDPEGVTAAHFERWKGDPSGEYGASIARTLAAGGSDADLSLIHISEPTRPY